MKKKLILSVVLIIFCFFTFSNLYSVGAFSGELDPEGYITFPQKIEIQNGRGRGIIALSSEASGYTTSYQKVDITKSEFDNIVAKNDEATKYQEETQKSLDEEAQNVKKLQEEYEILNNSGTAEENEIKEAYDKYSKAYDDYQKSLDEANANLEKLTKEFNELLPDYTNTWQTTTNIDLDLTDYSGDIYFALWVRITNGTNTYYDMSVYSTTIQEEEITISKNSANIKVGENLKLTATSSKNSEITWISSNNSVATVTKEGLVKGIKEGQAIITAKGSEKSTTCTVTVTSGEITDIDDETNNNSNIEWTDFSNAKIELKKDENFNRAVVEISNVIPKDGYSYYLVIKSDSSKPGKIDVTDSNLADILIYDEESKTLKTNVSGNVTKYFELNQDLYVSIIETYLGEQEVALYGKKLERYEEPKYSDAFFATFVSENNTQIITKYTHAKENNRKIQIKVGKITDASILQKIKNQDSSGFADLLNFAKSNNGIYDKILEADKDDYYAIEYTTNDTEKEIVNLTGLQDGAYYYLYIKTDDENGKYISNEAVTLAQADINERYWGLFFYGSKDFEWADFENITDKPNNNNSSNANQDDTTIKGPLPQTGVEVIAWIVLGIVLIAGGTFSYIQYRKHSI